VIATVYDVTVPEVRSTAQASEYFIENAGAAFAPILTGLIADMYSLQTAILLICTAAWLLCFFFYLGAIFTIDKDTHDLRAQMAERAKSI
jgi:fucose permease